jgi:hypothetical protein
MGMGYASYMVCQMDEKKKQKPNIKSKQHAFALVLAKDSPYRT